MYASQARTNTKYTEFLRNYYPPDRNNVTDENNFLNNLPLDADRLNDERLILSNKPHVFAPVPSVRADVSESTKFSQLFSKEQSHALQLKLLQHEAAENGGLTKVFSDTDLVLLHNKVKASFDSLKPRFNSAGSNRSHRSRKGEGEGRRGQVPYSKSKPRPHEGDTETELDEGKPPPPNTDSKSHIDRSTSPVGDTKYRKHTHRSNDNIPVRSENLSDHRDDANPQIEDTSPRIGETRTIIDAGRSLTGPYSFAQIEPSPDEERASTEISDLEQNLQKLNEETLRVLSRTRSTSVGHLEDLVPQGGPDLLTNVSYQEILRAEHVALRRELLNNLREISRATFYEDLYTGRPAHRSGQNHRRDPNQADTDFQLNLQGTADPAQRVDEWIRDSREHLNQSAPGVEPQVVETENNKPLHASLFHDSIWHENQDEVDAGANVLVLENSAPGPISAPAPRKTFKKRSVSLEKPVIQNNIVIQNYHKNSHPDLRPFPAPSVLIQGNSMQARASAQSADKFRSEHLNSLNIEAMQGRLKNSAPKRFSKSRASASKSLEDVLHEPLSAHRMHGNVSLDVSPHSHAQNSTPDGADLKNDLSTEELERAAVRPRNHFNSEFDLATGEDENQVIVSHHAILTHSDTENDAESLVSDETDAEPEIHKRFKNFTRAKLSESVKVLPSVAIIPQPTSEKFPEHIYHPRIRYNKPRIRKNPVPDASTNSDYSEGALSGPFSDSFGISKPLKKFKMVQRIVSKSENNVSVLEKVKFSRMHRTINELRSSHFQVEGNSLRNQRRFSKSKGSLVSSVVFASKGITDDPNRVSSKGKFSDVEKQNEDSPKKIKKLKSKPVIKLPDDNLTTSSKHVVQSAQNIPDLQKQDPRRPRNKISRRSKNLNPPSKLLTHSSKNLTNSGNNLTKPTKNLTKSTTNLTDLTDAAKVLTNSKINLTKSSKNDPADLKALNRKLPKIPQNLTPTSKNITKSLKSSPKKFPKLPEILPASPKKATISGEKLDLHPKKDFKSDKNLPISSKNSPEKITLALHRPENLTLPGTSTPQNPTPKFPTPRKFASKSCPSSVKDLKKIEPALFQITKSMIAEYASTSQTNSESLIGASHFSKFNDPPKKPQAEVQTTGYLKNPKRPNKVPGFLRRHNMDEWVAKKVWFYINGDEHFPKFEYRFRPKRDVKDLDALCDILSNRLKLARGVRHIFTIEGLRVERLEDLQNEHHYVASSTKKFKFPKSA